MVQIIGKQSDEVSYINICKGTRYTQRTIQVKSRFFSTRVIVKVNHNCIRFTKPTLDYIGKTHKPVATKGNWRTFQIVAELPIIKHLEFDVEESTEDELVVYYL